MEKKSSGGGQGSGGQQNPKATPPTKSSTSLPKMPGFESAAAKNPRATLDAVAAVVLPGADTKAAGPAVDAKKHLNANVFSAGSAATERKAKLPSVWTGSNQEAEAEEPPPLFDGTTPADELTSRDVWRAIKPPVQSKEGLRSAALYEQVINQFAVANNPRYEPDDPDKPRAHIFVWDVTRAMNAEIPHMLGARELTLAQTLDWLRYESSNRGWVRVSAASALEAANEGKPVIATPKQGVSKIAMLAIVRPGAAGPGGHPRVAAAAKLCGNDLTLPEAFGVHAFEYFVHA